MCHQVLNTWINPSIDWDRGHRPNQQVPSFSARHLSYHSQRQEHLAPILKYSLGCVRRCSFVSSFSNFWTSGKSLKPLGFIIWTLLMNKDSVSLFAHRRRIKELSTLMQFKKQSDRSSVLRKVLHYFNNLKDGWTLCLAVRVFPAAQQAAGTLAGSGFITSAVLSLRMVWDVLWQVRCLRSLTLDVNISADVQFLWIMCPYV